MTKINFTQEHYNRMQELLLDMLINNESIPSFLGSPLNVVDLLHTTTINSLNTIRLRLTKEIEKMEQADEWIQTDTVQEIIQHLKDSKELVNLIVGYKRKRLEETEIANRKLELKAKIFNMKEDMNTPEEKLKEAQEELEKLES